MNREDWKHCLTQEVKKIDAAMHNNLLDIKSELLREVLNYSLFNGGKRIRPLLTIFMARLCNHGKSIDSDALYRCSLSFEYLHSASLLHDDVIDKAELRRGKKSANEVWDNSLVILAGDFLHARAMALSEGVAGGLVAITTATEAMVEAEFVQKKSCDEIIIVEDDYYQVLNGKTVTLIKAACETGCLFVNGTEEQLNALQSFATNIGLIFQIIDDILDYEGKSVKTGKLIGNDWRERKITLPLIYAINNASATDKSWFLNQLELDSDIRADTFEQAHKKIKDIGGFDYARDKAELLVQEAINALSIFDECMEKQFLSMLATEFLYREK